MTTNDGFLTAAELAERWGVSRQAVHQRATKHRQILRPDTRYGFFRWRVEDVERYEREVLEVKP